MASTIEKTPLPYVYDTVYAERSIPTPPFAEGYKALVDEFIECCLIEKKKPSQTGDDARTALEICLAAYESSRKRKTLNLPLKKEVNVSKILSKL